MHSADLPRESVNSTVPARRYAVLFDIDGTLVDAGSAGRVAMEEAMADAFGLAAPSAAVAMAGRTDADIIPRVLAHNGLRPDQRKPLAAAYLRHLPEVLTKRRSRLLEGASEAVAAVRSRPDVLCGLLTGNLRDAAVAKLTHHELGDAFEYGVYGDEHPDRDDLARQAADELKAALGLCGDRVWIVGDTPADVRCGRAAGFRVAAVATGGATREDLAACEPDLLLASLRDFDGLLGTLESRI